MPACPKPTRKQDLDLIEEIRKEQTICMLRGHGKCFGGLDMHHIKSRGSGGEDVRGNLILLCRHHHQMAHNGKISKSVLYEAISE
jgi:hypothetical protein